MIPKSNLSTKSFIARAVVLLGDALLAIFLAWEIWQLRAQFVSVSQALKNNILAHDPEAFRRQLESQLPDTWLWLVVIVGLIATLALAALLLFTRGAMNKIILRINLVWLLAWAVLGVVLLVVLVRILSNLSSVFA